MATVWNINDSKTKVKFVLFALNKEPVRKEMKDCGSATSP